MLMYIPNNNKSLSNTLFPGSTNFGFLNGANSLQPGENNSGLLPTTTSYDYDAPLTEYGDYTQKYTIVKDTIAARNQVQTKTPDTPQVTLPKSYSKLAVEKQLYLSTVIKNAKQTFTSHDVIPMELLPINNGSGQSFGYIVYRKSNVNIPANAKLKISGYVRDTILVLINGKLINTSPKESDDVNGFGFWKKKDSTLTLTDTEIQGATLDLVVENFGRNNYGHLSQFRQFKGLTDPVYINDNKITDWQLIPLEFKKQDNLKLMGWQYKGDANNVPALYKSTLTIDDNPQDTFIDMRDWYKGIVIVNGFVLGRYFFLGPQQSLYLPAPLLVKGNNEIMIFEHFTAPESIKFSDAPIFGGPSHT